MEIWHERIKSLRENTDVTLKDMAKLIGVSEATVQRYECGKIQELPYKVITAYAEKFHVTPSYIMGWEDKPSPSPELIKLASQYKPDVVFSHDLSEIEYNTAKSDNAILAYANKFKELLELASTLNKEGIDDLTKYAKLMSNSEDYKKEE